MALRTDLAAVAELVEKGSRVLDIGCGDGALLAYLEQEKNCDARGLELSHAGVRKGVERGLSIVQGNADTDLVNYPNDGFDLVIMSQTLQATHNPQRVLRELLRIAPRVVLSIPNFGYWRVRLSLLFFGRMPVTQDLPDQWYETKNIHLCTICDLLDLCHSVGATVERMITLDRKGQVKKRKAHQLKGANLLATQAVFLISRA